MIASPAVIAWDVLLPDERRRLVRLLQVSAVFGASNGLIIAVVGGAVDGALSGADTSSPLIGYLALFGLTLWLLRRQRWQAARLVADVTGRLRQDIARDLLRLDLRAFDLLDRARVWEALAGDTRLVSEVVPALGAFLVTITAVAFTLLYFIWLSPVVFWITFPVFIAGFAVLASAYTRLWPLDRAMARHETAALAAASDLVDGFKELKLNRSRRERFFAETFAAAAAAQDRARMRYGRVWGFAYVVTEVAVLCAAAAVVMLMPAIAPDQASLVVLAGIQILSLPAGFVLELPNVSRAFEALQRIGAVAAELADAAAARSVVPAAPGVPAPAPVPVPASALPADSVPPPGQVIAGDGVFFRYVDAVGRPDFVLGPLSFEVPVGQITFLVGGNGSGKSTLLKLMTGLYRPQAGAIRFDRRVADQASLRAAIATVFTDAHVFARLYGQPGIDPDAVAGLLTRFGLATRTRFVNGAFTERSLSTGQKKRLALVVALLEDKPILVLDEWAADQDPEFRTLFYHTLLPELRARGKTILAATHDDRYFGCADRLLRLERGRLVPGAAPAGVGGPAWGTPERGTGL